MSDRNPREPWIQTFTGRKFYPMHPDPVDVNIHDIAHALSLACRFNGHVRRFYSVAEHCLTMSYMVTPDAAIYAMLHDAPEAYLHDMAAPLKHLFPTFVHSEALIFQAILQAFGIPRPTNEIREEIKMADLQMLVTERNHFMTTPPEKWFADRIGIEPYENIVFGADSPTNVEMKYLVRLERLIQHVRESVACRD